MTTERDAIVPSLAPLAPQAGLGQKAAPRPRRRPPLGLTAVLITGVLVGIFGDFYASAYVTTMTAQAGGPMVHAAARAAGLLAAVRVEEGAQVQAGQVVARLDDADLQAGVLQATADLAGARAALAASRTTASIQGSQTVMNVAQAIAGIQANRAALVSAEAALTLARADHQRLKSLAATGIVSSQAIETAATAIVTARANLDGARARLKGSEGALLHARASSAEESVKNDGVEVGRALLQKAESQLALAKLRLEAADVRSPITGLVVRQLASQGEPVDAGQAILAVVDPARLWVTAHVDETLAPRVREGAEASVWFDALPGKRLTGKVAFVGGATAEAAGTATTAPSTGGGRVLSHVPVRIVLDTGDAALRPGLHATVRIKAWRGAL